MQQALASFLKQTCLEVGFADCGISRAHEVDLLHQRAYNEWIEKGHHGKMEYLARNEHLRFNPAKLMPGTKSILTVILNYFPEKQMKVAKNYRIAKYAYGQDYHTVIKQMLETVVQRAKDKFGEFEYRAFTDSAPIPDLYWAQEAGLGNRGKNSLLIHPRFGSFIFVGHIFLSADLPPDGGRRQDICVDCNRCIRACPTQALYAPGKIDAQKCISYQTIENKSAVKDVQPSAFKNWIYGCDICQDACPYNKNIEPHRIAALQAKPRLFELNKEAWEHMTPMEFGELFRGSAVKRAGYKGIKQNIAWLQSKFSED